MATDLPTLTVATGRTVLVYENPWPTGWIYGYEDDGGFVVELVLAKQRTAVRMLFQGLRVARDRGYRHVRMRLPLSYPDSARLRSLAARMGFTDYHQDEEYVDCVWYP